MFRSSSALASAYGIAVTGTMVVTTAMAFLVLWKCWKWRPATAALVIAPFLVVDLVFLMANLLKIVEGGWMPLAVGAALMVVMLTWRRGTRILAEKARKDEVRLAEFIEMLAKSTPERVKGVAVFLTGQPDSTPSALLHNLKHNKILHEHNVIMNVVTEDTPRVDDKDRLSIERLSDSFSACDAALRLHGGAERAAGARRSPCQGHDLRRDAYLLLPLATSPAARAEIRDAALAGAAVHLARPRGERREPVFRHTERPRRRGRYADHSLSAAARAPQGKSGDDGENPSFAAWEGCCSRSSAESGRLLLDCFAAKPD